jgi:hypothetical protein
MNRDANADAWFRAANRHVTLLMILVVCGALVPVAHGDLITLDAIDR